MGKQLALWLVLLSGVASAQEWRTDLNVALDLAKSQNKQVLLYFSVPENCSMCRSLEKNVFQTTEFLEFAQEHFILAKADFSGDISPETKAENLLIVEKYNKDGFFPLVLVLDRNAKVTGKSGVYNNENAVSFLRLLTKG